MGFQTDLRQVIKGYCFKGIRPTPTMIRQDFPMFRPRSDAYLQGVIDHVCQDDRNWTKPKA